MNERQRQADAAFGRLFDLNARANPQNRGRRKGMDWQVQAMVDWASQEAEHNEQVRQLFADFMKGAERERR
jgi:hypothetical protein